MWNGNKMYEVSKMALFGKKPKQPGLYDGNKLTSWDELRNSGLLEFEGLNLTKCNLRGAKGELVISMTCSTISARAFYQNECNMSVTALGVNAIWDSAFEHSAITSFTFCDNKLAIGTNAFKNCQKMTGKLDIQVKDKLIIGPSAFEACNVQEFNISADGGIIISPKAFADNTSLAGVTIKGPLQAIPQEAFDSCRSMGNCRVPKTVQTVEANAFRNCMKLMSIQLPSQCAISESAFANTYTSIKR